MQRCVDAKMQSLFRNILISPLEGEKKFLSELCELRNFREGYNLKYSCRNGNSDLPKQLWCIPLNKFLILGRKFNLFFETNFHVSLLTSHFSLKRKVAFTLAEVLITLGIIGIVAAITLPSLIQNYQKKETVAKLKRVYSVLQQATLSAQNDYGEVNDWDFSDAYEFGQKYYVPYLKTIQNYNKTTTYNYTDLAGELHSSKAILFVLADGTFVHILLRPEYQVPFHILVDLNGKRGPNILGRDLFAFSYYNGKLNTYNQYQEKWSTTRYSVSLAGTSGQCNRKAKGGVFGVGSYCSTLIMLDGWEISSDYPW